MKRSYKGYAEILTDCLQNGYVQNCNNIWYFCALQTLQQNDISVEEFRSAVKELLHLGRGKLQNTLIIGPANCGKTFLLKPISLVYRSFVNPATSNFAWVGAEEAELLFLNDFCWSPQIVPWHDLLLLLEGQPVHVPAPKTHFLQVTDQYLQQVPLSYSLLDMVSRNTERDDESAMESFQIPPQNFRDPKRVYLTMWQMFCTTCCTRMTNFQKKYHQEVCFSLFCFIFFYD